MHRLISFLFNCINSVYIGKDNFIFSRITCPKVFIQSYVLLNIIENTKGKGQFGE